MKKKLTKAELEKALATMHANNQRLERRAAKAEQELEAQLLDIHIKEQERRAADEQMAARLVALKGELDDMTAERDRWRQEYLHMQHARAEARSLFVHQAHLAGKLAGLVNASAVNTEG